MDVEREQEWRDYITEGSGDPWRAVTYLEEALEALDHARSWPGLMEFIDRTWPAEVFTGESGDVGPRFIVVLRQLDAERAKVAIARTTLRTFLRGHPLDPAGVQVLIEALAKLEE